MSIYTHIGEKFAQQPGHDTSAPCHSASRRTSARLNEQGTYWLSCIFGSSGNGSIDNGVIWEVETKQTTSHPIRLMTLKTLQWYRIQPSGITLSDCFALMNGNGLRDLAQVQANRNWLLASLDHTAEPARQYHKVEQTHNEIEILSEQGHL